MFLNFVKFTAKHLCQSLFFNKVDIFRFVTETVAQKCSVKSWSYKFCKIRRKTSAPESLESLFSKSTWFRNRPWHRLFPVDFTRFVRTLSFLEHLWWLLILPQYCFKDTVNPLQLLIFTNVIRCSRLPLWLGYFIYFKLACLVKIKLFFYGLILL